MQLGTTAATGVLSVLVYGGTFDPVHNGHLSVASQAREATGADAVWFVPAAIPPLRDAPVASPAERLALLEEACALWGAPGLAVLDVAVRRGGVSYTADVMDTLRAEYPDLELSVLVGADAARTINRWHRADDLLRVERFVIVNRTGPPPLHESELAGLGYAATRTKLLTVDSPDISASDIRARVARGESLDGLVLDKVASLIDAKGLYRNNRDDA
jgi:nicotinate-nucleotide adenylyltransferase